MDVAVCIGVPVMFDKSVKLIFGTVGFVFTLNSMYNVNPPAEPGVPAGPIAPVYPVGPGAPCPVGPVEPI